MYSEVYSSDEKKLLSDLRQGEKGALEYIFTTHYTALVRKAMQYVVVPEVAEEIVQELLIKIWESRKEIQIQTSLAAYLFTAVRNRCLNYLKLQLKKEQLQVSLSKALEVQEEATPVITEDISSHLRLAIDALPSKCRNIFVLSKEDGMSNREIAQTLGIKEKTVENQMTIAFKKLREALSRYPYLRGIQITLVVQLYKIILIILGG